MNETEMPELHPIPRHPSYFASRCGQIWSKKHSEWRRLAWDTLDTYPRVTLCHGGKPRKYFCHVLTALTFLGPPPTPFHVVRHYNDDPLDGHVDNLLYGTHDDNRRDAERNGRVGKGATAREVIRLRDSGMSRTEISRTLGIKRSRLSAILSPKKQDVRVRAIHLRRLKTLLSPEAGETLLAGLEAAAPSCPLFQQILEWYHA